MITGGIGSNWIAPDAAAEDRQAKAREKAVRQRKEAAHRMTDAVNHDLAGHAAAQRMQSARVALQAYAREVQSEQSAESARELLRATGHEDANGPWLPIGAGVHCGSAFVGALGESGVSQITAIGDAVNLTARLASNAAAGEILVTESAYSALEPQPTSPERRELTLKGKSEPIPVYVLKVGAK